MSEQIYQANLDAAVFGGDGGKSATSPPVDFGERFISNSDRLPVVFARLEDQPPIYRMRRPVKRKPQPTPTTPPSPKAEADNAFYQWAVWAPGESSPSYVYGRTKGEARAAYKALCDNNSIPPGTVFSKVNDV